MKGTSWAASASRGRIRRARTTEMVEDFSVTPEAIEALKVSQNNRCRICARAVPLTVDHIVPLIGGGCHTMRNIQMLCFECNTGKSIHLPDFVSPNRTILYFPVPIWAMSNDTSHDNPDTSPMPWP